MFTENVQQEYDRLARRYDRRWANFTDAVLQATTQRLNPGAGERILDVGCGTGSLQLVLAGNQPTLAVTGVDLSLGMLGVARGKLGPRAPLVAGRAEQLPFRSEYFDIVVSCNSFHFWRKPQEALLELSRVLKPGGRLVVTDWCDDYIACRVCDWFLRVFAPAHFKTYGRAALHRMLEQAGYRAVVVDRYKIDWIWGLMTACGSVKLAVKEGRCE